MFYLIVTQESAADSMNLYSLTRYGN